MRKDYYAQSSSYKRSNGYWNYGVRKSGRNNENTTWNIEKKYDSISFKEY